MMISITTPALLFPAISLLLLAYTNRFMVLAGLIRELSHEERKSGGRLTNDTPGHQREDLREQMLLLNQRIGYIRNMQALGIISFIICTASMCCLFVDLNTPGAYLFGVSLITLVVSLLFALVEVLVSTKALSVEMRGIFPINRTTG
jgi:hypothetical protein